MSRVSDAGGTGIITDSTTGVKISNTRLVIATIRLSKARLRLERSRSAMFALPGREQPDMLKLAEEVGAFCATKQVAQMIVRAPLARGSHSGSGLGFKIEAMLQLLPGLRIQLVSSISTAAWLKRTAPKLPDPDRKTLKSADAKLQAEAIQTAAHHWAERRVLSELLLGP